MTTEAEYISLSQRKRDLIPLRQIMLDVSSVLRIKCDSCNSYTTTFEDNKGAIEQKNQNTDLEQNIFPSNCIILESIKTRCIKDSFIEKNEQQSDIMKKTIS